MIIGSTNSILLVTDDQEAARFLMEWLMIEGGFGLRVESTGSGAIENFKDNRFDLVLIKNVLEGADTFELVKQFRNIDSDCVVIGLANEHTPEIEQQMLNLSVYDYLCKPFNSDRLLFLARKGAELHAMLAAHRRLSGILKEQNSGLQKQNILLAKRIEESTRNLARLYEDLRSTYMRTIRALAQAIDARDHYTHSHSENVSKYSVALARELGFAVKDIEIMRDAAELHDIGKIGISDLILLKPSSLTQEEWLEIKKHPQTGAQILEPLTFLSEVIELVRQHHEHFDGSGYPGGKKGPDILQGARILHVADAYDAMVSARSYRKVPLSKEQAIAELKRNSGTQFDPQVVEAFLKLMSEF